MMKYILEVVEIKRLYILLSAARWLPKALLDTRSSVDVIPMDTLSHIPVDLSHMWKTHLVVRVFDGTRKELIENMELPIQIRTCIFNIDFQVMDINPSYNCLLGRPWIHMDGAVPSTLHQKVKLIVKEQLISMAIKENIVSMLTTFNPYIEVDENAFECSF